MRNTIYQNCTYCDESHGAAPRWVIRDSAGLVVCECWSEIATALLAHILSHATDEQIEAARDHALATVKTTPFQGIAR
jgi:hypothetical protein